MAAHQSISIVGGGVTGFSLLSILSKRLPSIPVTLYTAFLPPPPPSSPSPDVRTYALSPGSVKVLSEAGVDLGSRCQPYTSMQVWDSLTPSYLRFSSSSLDLGTPNLGVCAEDSYIVSSLHEAASKLPNAKVTTDKVAKVDGSRLTTEGGDVVDSSLLIASDGGNSFVRKSQNYGCTWHDYGRTSLICTVRTSETSSVPTAFQRFFPAGPLALLPLWGGYYSIVWSTTPEHARALRGAGEAEFVDAVNSALQGGPSRYQADTGIGLVDDLASTLVNGLSLVNMNEPLGSCGPFAAPPLLDSLGSERFLLPLHAHHAGTYYKEGQVLVGDAAHGVHPMAGQGLNLGLKGVRSLADQLTEAHGSGVGLGDDHPLSCYEADRRSDVAKVMGGIHALHHVFGWEGGPGVAARSVGMTVT
eukprot:CAMPEP_0182458202 /NCGR_PEP_ID=MMETSP1319-20130603/3591_1 /TAXON_ID=172717 /ORGANISM="Bolidomonas pacifica, Strain RCC208" /LENGTH=414 /DNA_ID=CAMNT_0024656839 /DNA_START=168 /DNA_END=1408 /DNA_ORIENTATION=-